MKNKIISIILSLALVFGLLPLSLIACSGGDRIIRRETNEQEYDFSDYKAIPTTGKEVNKDLYYINMDPYSNNDLFMAVSLQGNVNKDDPSIYVIHDEMIEGNAGINATQYWFDNLDETYTGEEAFNKIECTDPYKMVVDFKDHIKGAVLYHERLVDAEMTSRNNYSGRYADMAVLNLTVMMAAKYDAVALTYEQYNKLRDEYGLELDILGDTTLFMEKDADGNISSNRGSREVWAKVYLYALNEFKDFNKKALGHLAGNQAATIDYFIANDIFVYNRIFTSEATETERAIEDAIVSFSDPNTPVFGCWYLQADEGALIPYLTENYKFFIVNYETFNWSWSTALPEAEFKPAENEEKITLDETKNYVAFSFSEGDNNSYVSMRMPLMFDNDPREADDNYPVGWTMAPTLTETNPNFVKYYQDNWRAGDGWVIPEAGIDYVYHCPPEASQDEYFALSNEYIGRMGGGVMRVLNPDVVDPLQYLEHMDNLNGLSVGYYETGNTYYNSELSNFMFRGKPVFLNYSGADIMNFSQAESQGPGFYCVTLLGWNQDVSTIKNAMELLGDNWVCVTANQLADLYKQKYEKEFVDITSASFDANMSREEMGFLWEASDYTLYDALAGSRLAYGKEYFIYNFDFASSVTEANLKVEISGDYQIEVSTDYLDWYVIDSGTTSGREIKEYDLSRFVSDGQSVYVRFGDATPDNEGGMNLYRAAVSTDQGSGEGFEVDSFDEQILAPEGGTNDGTGRTGTFTYSYNFDEDVADGILAVVGGGSDLKLEISKDNSNFTEVSLTSQNKSKYAELTGLSGKTYLRFTASEPVTAVKFTPSPDGLTQLNFSPVTNGLTDALLISAEETSTLETSFNSNLQVRDDNSAIFRLRTAEGVTSATLNMTISGMFKVEISSDNKTYTTLKAVNLGDAALSGFSADISDYIGGDIYIKVSLSAIQEGRVVRISKIRLLTNLTEDWLYDKIDSEREPDVTIAVSSLGRDGQTDYGIEDTESVEYWLLDKDLTSDYENTIWMHNYAIPRRFLGGDADCQVVYKFDFSDPEFWEKIGFEQVDVNRFRVSVYALNGFNVSVSNNGQDWDELYDTNDVNAQNGANARYFDFVLNDYVGEGKDVVYLRFKLSNVHKEGTTHPGQWESLRFYFN